MRVKKEKDKKKLTAIKSQRKRDVKEEILQLSLLPPKSWGGIWFIICESEN